MRALRAAAVHTLQNAQLTHRGEFRKAVTQVLAGHIHFTKFLACWRILQEVSDTWAHCYFGIICPIISAPASVWWCSTDSEEPCLPWPSAVLWLFQIRAFETSLNSNQGTQRHSPEHLNLHIKPRKPQALHFFNLQDNPNRFSTIYESHSNVFWI